MRHRLFKSLRIAVTAVSLLVCGLLIVFWVRSYTVPEMAVFPISNTHNVQVVSSSGVNGIDFIPNFFPPFKSFYIIDLSEVGTVDLPSFALEVNHDFSYARIPHWFLVTIFATIGALPWIKWRFSLRTLLIVLTLFALFFGAIGISL